MFIEEEVTKQKKINNCRVNIGLMPCKNDNEIKNNIFFRYLYSENDTVVEKLLNNFWGNFVYNGLPTSNFSTWPYFAKKNKVRAVKI